MNEPQPERKTLMIVARGHGRNRCIRVLDGNTIIEQRPIKRDESNEDAVKRVLADYTKRPEYRVMTDTNIAFDDTLTALLLDELEENE